MGRGRREIPAGKMVGCRRQVLSREPIQIRGFSGEENDYDRTIEIVDSDKGIVRTQAGPRICLGKDFAYRQMKIYAALLLHFFSFKLRDGETVHYRMTVTMFMEPGLNVRVFRR